MQFESEWDLLWRLGLALVLSAAIGLERELRQKSAGLRTYTLVGVGTALFMLVSGYAFHGEVTNDRALDPTRIGAQIVTGIGFIGGGLIFVRRDLVRGLTTAAGVWVTAAVGMAAGGNLPILATATTVAYFIVVYGFPPIAALLPRTGVGPSSVRLTYVLGRGVLQDALALCTQHGFTVADLTTTRRVQEDGEGQPASASVELQLLGRESPTELAVALEQLPGMTSVHAEQPRPD